MKKIILIAALAFILLIAAGLILALAFAGMQISPFGTVAVIPVKGSITTDKPALDSTFTSSELVQKLSEAAEDPSVSAILLDIDSPGGEIVSTKQVVYKIREAEKPIVAYIGNTGASGAYYIAAASDYIYADADSITGSIGVISLVMNIQELLDEVGVKVDILKEGRFKGMGNLFEELDDEQREILQGILSDAYKRFRSDIMEFRGDKLNPFEFSAVADGRILSGEQARDAGLIDALGTKKDALNKAAELAGLAPNPMVKYYSKEEPTLLDLLTASGYHLGIGFKQGLAETTYSSTEIRA